MQNDSIARQFFQQYLPAPLLNAIDLNQFKLEDGSYIDDSLQATFSDLVFSCKYNKATVDSEAKVILLIEHQSTPDKFIAFRVYHYLFNMLY
jgi:predicted transposase/invertase (TIGR01784 family)